MFVNGPESFTPDDAYHLGLAPEMDNVWVAAGFNSIGIQSAGGAGMALSLLTLNEFTTACARSGGGPTCATDAGPVGELLLCHVTLAAKPTDVVADWVIPRAHGANV